VAKAFFISPFDNRTNKEESKTYLQGCLKIVLISFRKMFHSAWILGSLHDRTCLLKMANILKIRQLATASVVAFAHACEDDNWLML